MRDSPHFRRLAAEFDDGAKGTVQARHVAANASSSLGGRRVLFYSHNGVGVGHLQRQLDLASAYRRRHPDAAVLMVTGSHAAGMFEFPPGIDYLKLPSLLMTDRYRTWTSRELAVPAGEVLALRTELLTKAVRSFAPDLLVADFLPAGPHGELLEPLAELERRGGRAVAGFRDVIDDGAFVRELWEENGTYEALTQHYAAICVYGDPKMVDFVEEYSLPAVLEARLHYCGYLGRGPQPTVDVPLYPRPLVIATCGGGADGSAVLEPFVEAAERLKPDVGGTWLMVTGPLMDPLIHERLAERARAVGVDVRRVVPGLRAHVALADCLVGMAGYNTACDVLSFHVPAVLIPRRDRSQEQSLRAARLAQWGVVQTLDGETCAPDELARAISTALNEGAPAEPPVKLDGLERAVDVFDLVLNPVEVRS